jgi:hypothetical protein
MIGVTRLFCHAFPTRANFNGLWDARIYARRVGNPFARRPNFYRKVATIPRHSGNEKGGRRAPDAAQRAALAERCAAEPGPSRAPAFGTVPVLRSSASQELRAASRPGHALAMTENTEIRFFRVIASEAKQSMMQQTRMWKDGLLRPKCSSQ